MQDRSSANRWQGGHRSKRLGVVSLASIAAIALLALNALALFRIGDNGAAVVEDCSHLPPSTRRSMMPSSAIEVTRNSTERHQQRRQRDDDKEVSLYPGDMPSNMTFVGISSSVESVTGAAIRFLVESACVHGIKSYVLLGHGSDGKMLRRRMLAEVYHLYLPLPHIDRSDRTLGCIDWMRVGTAPDEEALLNGTKARSGGSTRGLAPTYPNNPSNPRNRVARIKRSREYQRRQLMGNEVQWGRYEFWDYEHRHSVVGVVDLDMFGYPPDVGRVVDVARRYVVPGASPGDGGGGADDDIDKYHAVCANGLQVSNGRRAYYDVFSTILLPNTFLYRESDRNIPRGELDGEDVDLAKMTQVKTLRWFLNGGGGSSSTATTTTGENDDNVTTTRLLANRITASDREEEGGGGGRFDFLVPVRSCFNGLTLYRADVFFDSRCGYDVFDKRDMVYMSRSERQTCEHVVFNECLRRRILEREKKDKGSGDGNFRIAVKPDLVTLWHLLN